MDQQEELKKTQMEEDAQPQPEAKGKHKKTSEVETLKAELTALNDRFLRTAAEYDNYRKRTEREKQASVAYGIMTAVEGLLPVFDVLEKAVAADCADAEYKKGVRLISDMYKTTLGLLGVEEIAAEGQPFDPAVHCAVSREAKEGIASEMVVTVLQRGYKLGDRIIRPAMVTVSE